MKNLHFENSQNLSHNEMVNVSGGDAVAVAAIAATILWVKCCVDSFDAGVKTGQSLARKN